MPDSLLGLYASLFAVSVAAAAFGFMIGFLRDFLYLSGGHW